MYMKQANSGNTWVRWFLAAERNADCWRSFVLHIEIMIILWTTFDKLLDQRSLSMDAANLYKVPLR